MRQWLFEQWNDIKGNAKWALVLVILGIMMAAAIALTHGLSLWQQLVLAVMFLLMFAWAVFMTAERRYSATFPRPLRRRSMARTEAIDPALEGELGRLSEYELVAYDQLVQTGGMTGAQFSSRMQEWGFPIRNRPQELEVENVFSRINEKTTLISHDQTSGVWKLRDRRRG